jgi:ribosomal protein S18 acetylase RimI-like enzyme
MPTVVAYDERYRAAFARLNREFISGRWPLGQRDLDRLSDPRRHFVETGGQVLFVLDDDGIPVGTCALRRDGSDAAGAPLFELCGLAVSAHARRQGHGDRLVHTALTLARVRGARRVFVVASSTLLPAIRLYEKHGFRVTRAGALRVVGGGNTAADIEMAVDFDTTELRERRPSLTPTLYSLKLLAALLALALPLSGCAFPMRGRPAAAAATDAPPRTEEFVREELYFGSNRRDRPAVSDSEWAAFVHDVVTPHFPQGLTVLAGRGQYRMADGTIVEEGTRVIVLLYPREGAAERSAAVAEIARIYKHRFEQESVLRLTSAVRASFDE